MIGEMVMGFMGGLVILLALEILERRKAHKEQEFESSVEEMRVRAYQMGMYQSDIDDLENKMRDKRRRDQGNPHPIESVLEGSAK